MAKGKDLKARIFAFIAIAKAKLALAQIANLPKPMVYQGTIGQGGTVSSLPADPEVGDTYIVITDGTYGSFTARVGDIFVFSDNDGWTLVPTGDIDTWRNIFINGTEVMSVTNKDPLKLVAGTNISLAWDSTNKTITINVTGMSDKMDKSNPTGTGSFSLNRKANTTIATNSFAEGRETTASGDSSHAEGTVTIASANSAHAEGAQTIASGTVAHAEGSTTTASGDCSHAEGYLATASGGCSHAEGNNTIAAGDNQHVSGMYNIEDSNDTYAEIIGNGTSNNNRSNARTLDWLGNEVLAGTIDATGFGTTLSGVISTGLATKEDKHKTIPQTLTAGSTTLTFTDASILADSLVDVHAPIWYISNVQTAGSVVLTFPVQAVDMSVTIDVH